MSKPTLASAHNAIFYYMLRDMQRRETFNGCCRQGALNEKNTALLEQSTVVLNELEHTGAYKARLVIAVRMPAPAASPAFSHEISVEASVQYTLEEMCSMDISAKALRAAKEKLSETFTEKALSQAVLVSADFKFF